MLLAEYGNAIKLGINADNASVQIYLGAAYARAGKREQAQAIMNRLQARKDYVSQGELAVLHTALDNRATRLLHLLKERMPPTIYN